MTFSEIDYQFKGMIILTVDLHIHTTCSDGLRTPEETVKEALEKNIRAVAITDHDITTGIDLAIRAAKNTQLEIIPGVEINSVWDNEEVHILGYYIDVESNSLQSELEHIRQARQTRAENIIKKLQALNYDISIEDIINLYGNGAIGRPHIARALVRKGYYMNTGEVFDRLLARGGKAYVERYKISPFKAIEMIKDAGGIPVIAHPGIYKQEVNWRQIVEYGLMGIEVFHTKHDTKTTNELLKIANKFNLLITGGTDCHGIGSSSLLGTIDIPYEVVLRLNEIRS